MATEAQKGFGWGCGLATGWMVAIAAVGIGVFLALIIGFFACCGGCAYFVSKLPTSQYQNETSFKKSPAIPSPPPPKKNN